MAGVAALVTAALMALHAVVYLNASRWVRAALLPIVAMDFVLIPMLLARPHVLTWPLLALWTWLMLRAREQDRAPPLVAALLMTLWANLHGGFVFGLAIAAAFGLEALVASADKPRAFRQWLIFGVACVAAVFINGNGIEGVLHPLRFTQLQMLPLIDEWKPSTPGEDAVLLRRPGDHAGADRMEAAAAAVGALAAACGAARPRHAPGAAPGDAGDRRGDDPAAGLCARRARSSSSTTGRFGWIVAGRRRAAGRAFARSCRCSRPTMKPIRGS